MPSINYQAASSFNEMQNESKSVVKKSPWSSRQGSIDGEKQGRALYNMYGPDDSRAPQKGTKLATERLTWQSQLRAYIHPYLQSVNTHVPHVPSWIMELRMYHGALKGPVQPTLLCSYILNGRPTCQYRPPLSSPSDIFLSALHIPHPISISHLSYRGRLS